jgi:DNA-directed RNA polymerase subunit RPC12/RpoP
MNQKQVIMLEEEEQDALKCEFCSQKRAEIFQATGYYCLQCWQEETHPNV